VGDNYRLDVVNGDGLNAIRVDRQQFEQVIMNLVVNARDAMEGGGVITIETENLNLDSALVRDRATVPVGEYVSVEVRDTGVGIPEHKLQQVFEPFYTSKPVGEGTGLGLSTVYGIVKQSGGFIFVDSVVGEGTTFRLLFPAVSSEVQLTTEDATELPLALSPAVAGTVLLVEDEAPVRAFAARALRIKGLTVLEAGAATEALKILEDKELRIDLIVTDVIMPGLDGPSWVKKARAERPDTPVIFVSGYADGKFSENRLSIENSTFLPKPFSLAQLTATVDKQLNRVVEGLV
jgi:two-component system cell cycle sensor histidine kinase/response regulator CckA